MGFLNFNNKNVRRLRGMGDYNAVFRSGRGSPTEPVIPTDWPYPKVVAFNEWYASRKGTMAVEDFVPRFDTVYAAANAVQPSNQLAAQLVQQGVSVVEANSFVQAGGFTDFNSTQSGIDRPLADLIREMGGSMAADRIKILRHAASMTADQQAEAAENRRAFDVVTNLAAFRNQPTLQDLINASNQAMGSIRFQSTRDKIAELARQNWSAPQVAGSDRTATGQLVYTVPGGVPAPIDVSQPAPPPPQQPVAREDTSSQQPSGTTEPAPSIVNTNLIDPDALVPVPVEEDDGNAAPIDVAPVVDPVTAEPVVDTTSTGYVPSPVTTSAASGYAPLPTRKPATAKKPTAPVKAPEPEGTSFMDKTVLVGIGYAALKAFGWL